MAVSAKWYGLGALGLLSTTAARRVDWGTDTIKVALCTSTYTPDQDAHDFFNDITNEITGTGYTAGGVTLAGKTLTYDSATNQVRLDANDPSWSGASFTCRYAIVYKDTGTPSTSPVLGYIDFGADETIASGVFSITLDATGALRLDVA